VTTELQSVIIIIMIWSFARYRPTYDVEVRGLCRANFLHLYVSLRSFFHMDKSRFLTKNVLQGIKAKGELQLVRE